MNDRPLPRRWSCDSFARKMDEVRSRIARHVAEHPESTLRVVPRHRISGPQFDGPICEGCQDPVCGGPLHSVLLCGTCRAAVVPPDAA